MITANNVGKFTLGEEKKKLRMLLKGVLPLLPLEGSMSPLFEISFSTQMAHSVQHSSP